MAEVLPCLEWVKSRGRRLQSLTLPYGADHCLATGETLPEAAFAELRDGCDAILFGAVGDPRLPGGQHAEAILLRLRQGLDLTVNFRPCHAWVSSGQPPFDLEVFRENTEGPYCLQGSTEPGRAVDLAIHTESAGTAAAADGLPARGAVGPAAHSGPQGQRAETWPWPLDAGV
ncbi:MAG: hypothetical protein IPO28_01435 [Holophagaceae bacterium]|nr:hypothetical protein [Holophagaceae bacterium]